MIKKKSVGLTIFGIFFCLIGTAVFLMALGELSAGFFAKEELMQQTLEQMGNYAVTEANIIAKMTMQHYRWSGLRFLFYSIAFLTSGIGVLLRKKWARTLSLILVAIIFISTWLGLIIGEYVYPPVIWISSSALFLFSIIYLTRPKVKEQFE